LENIQFQVGENSINYRPYGTKVKRARCREQIHGTI